MIIVGITACFGIRGVGVVACAAFGMSGDSNLLPPEADCPAFFPPCSRGWTCRLGQV